MTASTEENPALATPYWRIEQEDSVRRLPSVAERMKMALEPVISIVWTAAPGAVARILLAQIISAASTAGMLILLNEVLGSLLEGRDAEGVEASWPALVSLILLFGLKSGADAVAAVERAKLSPKVRKQAEERLLGATLGVQLASYDDASFYDQLQRARDRGIFHLESSVEALVDTIASVLTVAAAMIALLIIHPVLVLLMLGVAIPGAWGALNGARTQYEGMSRTVALSRKADMYRDLATTRTAAPEIRANQTQPFLREQFRSSAEALQDHVVAIRTKEAMIVATGGLLAALALVVAFGLLAAMIAAGWLGLGAAGTAAIAMRAAAGSLSQLATSSHEIFQKALYISDYQQFLAAASEQATRQHGSVAPVSPRSIELRDVHFRYPGIDSPWVLRSVNLRIEAQQTVALVGENGSGKTTLAKVLAGLYEPTDGQLLWDGIDIRLMTPDSVADRVSMVLQDPVKWPHSARSNVEIGRYTSAAADLDRLEMVAAQSGALDVIRRLPKGWDTMLSREFSGGHDLSAGQWQRLAVARGLYRDAPIVIWDEPTAPLDAKSELAAYESLRQLARNRTVILITHRLTSVQNADQIFFLHEGELAEQGTHEALMAMNGRYARLFSLQARLFQATAS